MEGNNALTLPNPLDHLVNDRVVDGVVVVGAALVVVEKEEDEKVSSLEMEVGVVACATGPLLSSFSSFVVVVSPETLFLTTTSSSLVLLLLLSLPSLSLTVQQKFVSR